MEILIVKLGALGDVLRTTPLLTALKHRHPDARVHWLVDERCAGVLEKNPLIDRLYRYDEDALARLGGTVFDLAVNLDKEPEALAAINAVRALKKRGFGPGPDGSVRALDRDSEYAVRLGVDDELKFRKNTKTYQTICFEQMGLTFDGEEYIFVTDPSDERFAEELLAARGVATGDRARPVIGLNTGSGHRFAGKKLTVATLCQLARRLERELGAQVLLLGGQAERSRNAEIAAAAGPNIIDTGSHSIGRFAAIVRRCALVLSGDTTAMHIAVAVKTPVVVHFGSTAPAEIELYGRGRKIISGLDCAPCYKRDCPIGEACMTGMSVDELFAACTDLLQAARRV